jgi:hypothetical protein
MKRDATLSLIPFFVSFQQLLLLIQCELMYSEKQLVVVVAQIFSGRSASPLVPG